MPECPGPIAESRQPILAWRRGVVLVLLLAAALRFYGLGGKSLWLDEAGTAERTTGSIGRLVHDIAAYDSHPPVYYILLYALTVPFRADGLSEWELRFPSALFGLLTVWVVCLIERQLAPNRDFPLAGALFAFSAYAVYYSQEARHHALVTLWLCLSLWLLLRAMVAERPSWRVVTGFTTVATLAIYTYYYALFFLAAEAAGVLLGRKVNRSNGRRWALMFGAPLVLFLAYVPVIMQTRTRLAASNAPTGFHLVSPVDLCQAIVDVAQGYDPLAPWAGRPGQFLVAALALLPILLGAIHAVRRSANARLLLALLLIPFLCVMIFPIKPHQFQSKHLFFVTPIYFLLAGEAIWPWVVERPWSGVVGPASTLGLFILVLLNGFALGSYLSPWISEGFVKEDWRGAAEYLAWQTREGDLILPSPEYLGIPLTYYLRELERRRMRWMPEIRLRPGSEQARASADILRRAKRVWVVELQSPVSFQDWALLEEVRRSHVPEKELLFCGFEGTIRVTCCGPRESLREGADPGGDGRRDP